MAGDVEDRAVGADRHDGTARGADRVLVDVDTPERAAPEAPPQSGEPRSTGVGRAYFLGRDDRRPVRSRS
jgi:hypothetical protein